MTSEPHHGSEPPVVETGNAESSKVAETEKTVPTVLPPPSSPIVASATSKSRLQADAQPFIPRRPSSAIVIKNPKGQKVDIHALSKPASNADTPSGPPTFSVAVSNPIKIESEADKKKREESLEASRLAEHDKSHSAAENIETAMILPSDEAKKATGSPEPIQGGFETGVLDNGVKSAPQIEFTELTVSPTSETLNHQGVGSVTNQHSTIENDDNEDWSSQQIEIPVLATSPPTALLDSGFQMTLPPLLEKPTRERSRRGLSRRTTDAAGNPITRTRSGEPRKRPTPGRLDLSGIPKPAAVATGALASAITNANPIRNIQAVIYPNDIFGPSKELNEGINGSKIRYDAIFSNFRFN